MHGLAQVCRNESGMLRDPRQGAAGCGSCALLLLLKCPVVGYTPVFFAKHGVTVTVQSRMVCDSAVVHAGRLGRIFCLSPIQWDLSEGRSASSFVSKGMS